MFNVMNTNIEFNKEPEDDTAICVNCKHYKTEGEFEHNCYANASEDINYVTGDRQWEDVEDCEDANEDGDCKYFEKKDMSKDQEKQ